MSDLAYKNDYGSITLRDNHWDSRAFNQAVFEITNWNIEENKDELFFEHFAHYLETSEIDLCLARIQLDKKNLIQLLQEKCCFLYTETSLGISLQNVGRELIHDPKLSGRSKLREMREEDLADIETIAMSVFKYGRFAEDLKINTHENQLRQKNWVHDLARGPNTILVNESSNGITSFMAYKKHSDDHAELILGGSAEGLGFTGVFFWHDLMKHLANTGVKRIDTVVSAANLSVVRLYESLGFKLTNSWAGLHWHSPR